MPRPRWTRVLLLSCALACRGEKPPLSPPLQLVAVPGGWLTTGPAAAADAIPGDGELPRRTVWLPSFLVSADEVTCAQFRAFVSATGHITTAERLGSSFVAAPFLDAGAAGRVAGALVANPLWLQVAGASWRFPGGGGGPGAAPCAAQHPVVHVSASDGEAFCAWAVAGGRLPTEEEWEMAAHGGGGRKNSDARFPWGDDDDDTTTLWRLANTFTGGWPHAPDAADGHRGTAPVGSYPRNALGLADAAGNVWEWTVASARARASGEKVQKGGSHMCHRHTCWRYRVSARVVRHGDSTAGHVGFRCAGGVEGEELGQRDACPSP